MLSRTIRCYGLHLMHPTSTSQAPCCGKIQKQVEVLRPATSRGLPGGWSFRPPGRVSSNPVGGFATSVAAFRPSACLTCTEGRGTRPAEWMIGPLERAGRPSVGASRASERTVRPSVGAARPSAGAARPLGWASRPAGRTVRSRAGSLDLQGEPSALGNEPLAPRVEPFDLRGEALAPQVEPFIPREGDLDLGEEALDVREEALDLRGEPFGVWGAGERLRSLSRIFLFVH